MEDNSDIGLLTPGPLGAGSSAAELLASGSMADDADSCGGVTVYALGLADSTASAAEASLGLEGVMTIGSEPDTDGMDDAAEYLSGFTELPGVLGVSEN